ncbi:MAG: hypothetical protein EOQ50_13755 [Mesorhizobium sp.]|nr:MAG: hypothetical protein EOQ50_13755 [Mesorhizobium sp.]RWL83716.1 MAG: hypothetical protein EOR69_11860 [Mesorhizobium sp.]RWL90868.1 MAG: hypothetical protein EOR67_04200 [Mesorhizobium sp.]RWM00365.1 MAG: hypothetical protein EOR70_09430 [Mesorhizobium sp.]TIP04011.1 MAG: hypothetical protein E5X72_13830 [Mesorhizobium sp.]
MFLPPGLALPLPLLLPGPALGLPPPASLLSGLLPALPSSPEFEPPAEPELEPPAEPELEPPPEPELPPLPLPPLLPLPA